MNVMSQAKFHYLKPLFYGSKSSHLLFFLSQSFGFSCQTVYPVTAKKWTVIQGAQETKVQWGEFLFSEGWIKEIDGNTLFNFWLQLHYGQQLFQSHTKEIEDEPLNYPI